MSDSPKHITICAWTELIRTQQQLLDKIENDLKDKNFPPLTWYDVLLELSKAPDKKIRISELGEKVLLTRSNITRLVDRLEKQSLVTRENCPDDRRGYYACLSEKGEKLKSSMWPVYKDGINQYFSSKLSESEQRLLLETLKKLRSPTS